MIFRRRSSPARVSGRPPSANGASSLHLRWETAGELTELAVTLTVVEAPRVSKLYFWALQADFSSLGGGLGQHGRLAGGAHLGVQWHPRHPGSTAVNWGGYGPDGRELQGSTSALPSALRNANTRDYPWSAGVGYRLHIAPAPVGTPTPEGLTPWRASITDTSSSVKVEVRDLYVPGERISGAVMWSEVFADCDDPPVTVRWSHPFAVSATGAPVRITTMSVNYQSRLDGGCDNTTAWASQEGWFQRTCTPRATPQGTVLRVEPSS